MIRPAALTAAVVLAATSIVAGPSVAGAAVRDPLEIQLVRSQVKLAPSGGVFVKVRIRCNQGLDAFEVDLGVTQGTALAADTPRTDFPVCNGRWQSRRFELPLLQGSFTCGPATATGFVAAYDPAEGDLSDETSVAVRL